MINLMKNPNEIIENKAPANNEKVSCSLVLFKYLRQQEYNLIIDSKPKSSRREQKSRACKKPWKRPSFK